MGRWRETEPKHQLILPTSRPIFSWTDNGTIHQSPMNPMVKKRIDLQVVRKQLRTHTGSTANFLTREDNSKDLLGKFHRDKSVWIHAKRTVLQCTSYQFPCALQLKIWGILNEVKCYYVKNITLGKEKKHGPSRLSRECGTHTMLLPSLTTPTDCHTSR